MIQYFVDHEGAHGIHAYLRYRGAALAGSMRPVEYETLPSLTSVAASSAIFTAVDHIGPTGRAIASGIGRELRQRGWQVLNDPESVLCRYELLTALYAAGVNRFRARRASEPLAGVRYPVFIRQEHHHNGSQTGLLPDRDAVERALTELVLRGYRRADLLVVEFCDTRSADGLYRKYSAFRIGDLMLPRHVHVSNHWVSKSGSSLVNEDTIREERRYFDERPHEDWLWEVFRTAHIEYGRIDYGTVDGVPQVWEINTNPTLTRSDRHPRSSTPEKLRPEVEVTRLAFHTQFLEALRSLDSPASSQGEVVIAIAPAARRKMASECRGLQRGLSRIRIVQRVVDWTPVQRLRPLLVPIAAQVVRAVARVKYRRTSAPRVSENSERAQLQ